MYFPPPPPPLSLLSSSPLPPPLLSYFHLSSCSSPSDPFLSSLSLSVSLQTDRLFKPFRHPLSLFKWKQSAVTVSLLQAPRLFSSSSYPPTPFTSRLLSLNPQTNTSKTTVIILKTGCYLTLLSRTVFCFFPLFSPLPPSITQTLLNFKFVVSPLSFLFTHFLPPSCLLSFLHFPSLSHNASPPPTHPLSLFLRVRSDLPSLCQGSARCQGAMTLLSPLTPTEAKRPAKPKSLNSRKLHSLHSVLSRPQTEP